MSVAEFIGWAFLVAAVGCLILLVYAVLGTVLGFVWGLLGLPVRSSRRTVRVRPPIPYRLRTKVLRRDHWQCVYCGSKEELQIDHIIPVSRGGATVFANLETLCGPCNRRKGAS